MSSILTFRFDLLIIRDLHIRVRVRLSNFKSVTSPELSLLLVVYQQIRRLQKQDWRDKWLSKPRKLNLKSRTNLKVSTMHLVPVACFLILAKAWQRFLVFTHLVPVACFRYHDSYSCCQLHVFVSLALVACFPMLS